MKAIIKIIFVILIIPKLGHSQNIRTSILDTVEKFETFYFTIHRKRIHEDIARYKYLKDNITSQEIYSLTFHKNPVVKAYAFQLMLVRKDPRIGEKYVWLLNQEPIFIKRTRYGNWCEVEEKIDLTLYFFDWAYNCSGQYKDIIDSICLFSEGRNKMFQSYTLANTKPKKHYYNKVKELVSDSTSSNSIFVLLAKYKKQQDIQLFIEYHKKPYGKNQILRALKYFPDKAFKPLIQQTIDKCISNTKAGFSTGVNHTSLCFLLINYNKNWVRKNHQLLIEGLSKDRFELVRYLNGMFCALTVFPNSKFEDLYKDLSNNSLVIKPKERWDYKIEWIKNGFDPG